MHIKQTRKTQDGTIYEMDIPNARIIDGDIYAFPIQYTLEETIKINEEIKSKMRDFITKKGKCR